MPKLKHVYAKSQNIRVIDASDMKSVGVEGFTKTFWEPKNNHTAEVSQEAADWLMANEPGDWELIEDEVAEDSTIDASTNDGEGEVASGEGGDGVERLDRPTSGTAARRAPRRS